MAKRISELPAAGAVAGTDELELNQSGTSRKATHAQIVAGLANATHTHTLADVTDAGTLAAKTIVGEADIAAGAVTNAKLGDLSVDGGKLALDAVSTDRLADDAVTTAKIADGAVTTGKLAPNAVDSTRLADNAVTASKIVGNAVTNAKIAANAVMATQLATSAVTTGKIAPNAVTNAKIGVNAVAANQLAGNAVIEAKIADNAVTAAKISANAVGPTKLANNAVTNPKIADGAVTSAKIAADAVGPDQLASTTVTPGVYTVATLTVDQQGRLTAASSGIAGEANTGTNVGVDGVGVFAGKLGTDLQFRHIAPASNKVAVTLNGEDIDLDVVDSNLLISAGNVTGLGDLATKNVVAESDIANGAVTTAKLADLAVDSDKLAMAAVSTQQLADNAVSTLKIASAAVTTAKIAADAVDSTQLVDDAVVAAKIASNAVVAGKIAASAVDSIQLADDAVVAAKIAGNAVVAGKIAADAVDSAQLADDAVTMAKIANSAVTTSKIAAKVIGPGQLADTAVTPGVYPVATITVDQQGRLTAASSGTAGEANTGSNVGADGVGVFAGKVGVGLRFRHIAPASNKVTVTLNGDDVDIDVVESNLQVAASNVTGLGALATKDMVAEADIAENAVTMAQLADDAVTADKIAADAVGPGQLADTAVSPGVYAAATVTVDQQGRITAASSGTAGEVNTGSNVGADGVGVFAGKVGVGLQFRHIAPASNKVLVTLNGDDVDIDVVESNLQVAAGNVTGLAAVATSGTLASLTSLDANGGALTNYVAAQDTVAGAYTFVQSDSGREKIFTGAAAAMWTIPALNAGTQSVVHNIGTAAITFAASGVTLKGMTTLASDQTAAISWLPGNVVKLIGELS